VKRQTSRMCVVQPRAGGSDEIIIDQQNGILVSIGDIAAIVAAITTLSTSSANCDSFGRAGRAGAVRRFCGPRMVEAYALYANRLQADSFRVTAN
jgi:hypothetical protein